jgi:hypothetical protein
MAWYLIEPRDNFTTILLTFVWIRQENNKKPNPRQRVSWPGLQQSTPQMQIYSATTTPIYWVTNVAIYTQVCNQHGDA